MQPAAARGQWECSCRQRFEAAASGHAIAQPAWLAARCCSQSSNLLLVPSAPAAAALLLPQVEEIALLKTVLVRWDGARIYYPNNKLNTELLLNLSRSANKSESLKVGGRVAAGTLLCAGMSQ